MISPTRELAFQTFEVSVSIVIQCNEYVNFSQKYAHRLTKMGFYKFLCIFHLHTNWNSL